VNLPTTPPIRHAGRLWFFFGGRSQAHSFPHPAYGSIGLAQLRIDGFASLQAVESTGLVLTKPLTWPGGDLLLNADPRRHLTAHRGFCSGQVSVELRDEQNRPIPGYTWTDAVPVTGNTGNAEDGSARVEWSGNRSADGLAGRRVRLAFKLNDAHLYSFRAKEPRTK
jgi:hypothetical protein